MKYKPQIGIPASYIRGGTSKGVFFRCEDLPLAAQVPGAARDDLLLRVPLCSIRLFACGAACFLQQGQSHPRALGEHEQKHQRSDELLICGSWSKNIVNFSRCRQGDSNFLSKE